LTTTTVAQAIAGAARSLEAAGIDDALLEAEVLAAHALATTRSHVLAQFSSSLSDADALRFEDAVARRLRREPLAYITGQREFYGIDIRCGPGALIPRPETELVVEIALEHIARIGGTADVVDVGTGTGAIAVAIAANAPGARITAVDASDDALRIARQNIDVQGLGDRIALRRGDMLEGLGAFDVMVANLPYVTEREWATLQPEVRDWEPRGALVAGSLGTEANERLLEQAPAHLRRGGIVVCEIGATQGAAMRAPAGSCFPEARIHVRTDLAGLDRVLVVET
jgi:release factor glutamine methyltransferase